MYKCLVFLTIFFSLSMPFLACADNAKSANELKPLLVKDSAPPNGNYGGGDGSSMEKAVIIQNAKNSFEAIPLEYAWLKEKCPGYQLVKQTLLFHEGKKYDLMVIRCGSEEQKEIYFDITSCFGRGTQN